MIESEIKKKTGRERVCLPRSVALGAGLPTPPNLGLLIVNGELRMVNGEW